MQFPTGEAEMEEADVTTHLGMLIPAMIRVGCPIMRYKGRAGQMILPSASRTKHSSSFEMKISRASRRSYSPALTASFLCGKESSQPMSVELLSRCQVV